MQQGQSQGEGHSQSEPIVHQVRLQIQSDPHRCEHYLLCVPRAHLMYGTNAMTKKLMLRKIMA